MEAILFVGLGGAFGAISRFYIVQYFAEHWLSRYHFATIVVNGLGAFLMLFFMTLFIYKITMPVNLRLFFAVGFLGSLTTFSTFTYETLQLFQTGYEYKAFLNIMINNVVTLILGSLGIYVARLVPS